MKLTKRMQKIVDATQTRDDITMDKITNRRGESHLNVFHRTAGQVREIRIWENDDVATLYCAFGTLDLSAAQLRDSFGLNLNL
tara:strand:- start:909 stop:1157 length:249 start_codon:yes stop_codon:yes gene_type:complete